MNELLVVPAAGFGSDLFWARLSRLADERGHLDHPRMLVGFVEPQNRYTLRCERCREPVVQLAVDRAGR
ncbi:hypothetical protein OHQ88_33415 (plasmid) [Micromonospora zamorensis]|uniref:hypothetical protein n=1 Tax=Micromonospora zamorensis TaxID=709883 RepID=UPI002E1A2F8E